MESLSQLLMEGEISTTKCTIQLDIDKVVMFINTDGQKLLNTTTTEIVGRCFLSFLKDRGPEFDAFQDKLLEFSTSPTKKSTYLVSLLKDKKGNLKRILWFFFDLKNVKGKTNGYMIIGDDLSREVASLTQKVNIENYLSNILMHFPGYLYWKDKNSVYLGCNMNFAQVAGLSLPEDIIGKTDYDLAWGKTQADLFRKGDQEVLMGRPLLNIEEPQLQADGRIAIALASKVPLWDKEGNISGIFGIYSDITERKNMEKNLLEANKKLELLNKELLVTNELKTKFIQNMQHDVRTPLAGVYQYMEIWAREETDSEKKHCAELMRASTGQLLNMCNELVDFENIEYLGDTVHPEPVETAKFLSKVIDLNRMAAHSRDLEIKLIVESNVPPRLKLDKKKLYRVLVNLIGNSLKFTDEGSVILYVKALSVSLTSATISFEIHDTGVGIPEDKINLIFDKFVRLNPSNQAKYKGSGLGLFYVKKFVDDMQGKLEVESVEGRGSIFRVILTLAIPSPEETVKEVPHEIDTFQESVAKEIEKLPDERFLKKASAKAATSINSRIAAPLTSSPQILLIEDDPIQQKMISKTIKDIGGKIAKIVDNVSLSCAAINEWKYDLVISDLGIRGGSGIDVINWVKENKTHPNQQTPFIALTANADDDMRKTALSSGFNYIYVKPLTRKVAENILTKYVVKQGDDINLSQDNHVIDINASLEVGTDIEILKELFSMLTESIMEDKKQLQIFFEKNDVESTRKLLHRLDGTFRYCAVPMLQQTRTALHNAIRDKQTLDKVTKFYDAFYKEIDNYLVTYQKFKKNERL